MPKLDRAALLFGAVAAVLFILTFLVLGMLSPGYHPASQTISELGEAGSPFEFTFSALMMISMICLCVFTVGLFRFSSSHKLSYAPASVLSIYPLCGIGIYIFAAPHPLHNVFGIASMFGAISPLVTGLTWKENPDYPKVRPISIVSGLILLIEIGLNISPLFVKFGESDYIRTHYGAIQKLMYLTFYGWLAYLAVTTFRRSGVETRLAV